MTALVARSISVFLVLPADSDECCRTVTIHWQLLIPGQKGPELHETRRRQQKLLISNKLREADRNPSREDLLDGLHQALAPHPIFQKYAQIRERKNSTVFRKSSAGS